MPIWEDYQVTVTVTWEVKSSGKFVCSGMVPGESRGTSNRETNGLSMEQAVRAAMYQAEGHASAMVRASEVVRRRGLGYKDGD